MRISWGLRLAEKPEKQTGETNMDGQDIQDLAEASGNERPGASETLGTPISEVLHGLMRDRSQLLKDRNQLLAHPVWRRFDEFYEKFTAEIGVIDKRVGE